MKLVHGIIVCNTIPAAKVAAGIFFCPKIWFCPRGIITFAMTKTLFHQTSTIMIDIDFTSGFQAIQNKGVHYRFAFANIKNENAPQIQLAAANIIRKFTDTDPGGYSATFIRDGLSGEIYAVLQQVEAPYNQTRIIEFPEGKEHFLRQFPDWVVIEPEDADQFKLNFTDNMGGWLPKHWAVITECFKNPQRPKSKKSVPVVWLFRNHVLKFHRESGIFTLFNLIPGATDGMNLISVCRFTENEIFKNPK